ncbi:MAG: hypothetical protein HPY83_01960 [Anaerolineae bacterium]|nr:hypothetical protein [Anaerolineae bacterium]
MLPDNLLALRTDTVPGERRSKRLRHFVAALKRYEPLLVLSLDPLGEKGGSMTHDLEHVLVVDDGTLDWETVDRLSDGVILVILYSEGELTEELGIPGHPLYDSLLRGSVLYERNETRDRLLRDLVHPELELRESTA